jgi:hydrogenase-4 component B
MTTGLFLASLIVWAAGAALGLLARPRRASVRSLPFLAGLIGSGLVTACGVRSVLGEGRLVSLGSTLSVGVTAVRFDHLAGLFLTLTGGLGVVVSACLLDWVRPAGRLESRAVPSGYLLLLGAVSVVIVAADAFTFLFAWEALALSFYMLVGSRRGSVETPRRSWVTLGFSRASGAALLFGFLLLAGRAHSYAFSQFAHVAPGSLHDIAFALVVVGFGAKVGIAPFEVWLPIAYPGTPGPVRAALSGLAVNVGFYGLFRFLGVLGAPPIWLVVIVLVVGGLTALVGIVFAAVQSSLNRVIAFSSVENAGIILVAYGVGLAGAATHHEAVLAVGLLAASLQVLAHAVAKSSLFASSAFFESALGSDQLEVVRGVGRSFRASGLTFALGSLTLAGLPPTIGFVSEWFIFEALLQEFRTHVLALRLGMAFAGALVALTAGVAALCFIRLIGFVVLGPASPAIRGSDRRLDGGVPAKGGLLTMAVACLGLAAAAPWVVRFLARGLSPVVPASVVRGALRSPWVLQPVFSQFSILSPSWLFVVMPIGIAGVSLLAVALSRGGLVRVRRVPAWRSASSGVSGPSAYTPFGYANALRHVLANVLGSQRSATVASEDRSAGPDRSVRTSGEVEVRTTVVEPVAAYLYRPARAGWLWLAEQAKRLQSGRLDAYVGYMLVALLVVLAVVAAMK